MKRPTLNRKTPLHITSRLKEKLPSLRHKSLFREFTKSVKRARLQGLYILHFSIQSNHIHLIAEADHNRALAKGMRSLAGRLAKILRGHSFIRGGSQKGSVFGGRYHLHVLRSPSEVRNALEYVLLNLSKHQKFIEYIDEYSSGGTFSSWKKLLGSRYRSLIKFNDEFFQDQKPTHLTDVLSQPNSWLAKVGWMKACG